MADKVYDLLIIGGGVVGTASYFRSSLSPKVTSAALLEKYQAVATVNSNVLANAETLHEGAKETNFDLPKALTMQRRAQYLIDYLKERGDGVYLKIPSMVIGVNQEERNKLEKRFEMLHFHYPNLELIGWQEIQRIEPKVVEGRSEAEKANLVALYSEGYAVDYEKLAQSFVREGDREAKARGKDFQVFYRTKVLDIRRDTSGLYVVETDRGIFRAKVLNISAGPYSLMFAKQLGLPEADRFAILPVAGSFYYTKRKFLNGKVYTVQEEHLPFAAPHADRAVYNENETRFGPTAIVLPFFERYHLSTLRDFILMGMVSPYDYSATVLKILTDPALAYFELKNIGYNTPFVGKQLFTALAARKIIPTIDSRDLNFGKGMGGIRPQLLDLKNRKLQMGLGKFVGERVICNVTPSPGASSSLGNAEEDMELIEKFLDEYSLNHKGGYVNENCKLG